jgi:predicted nucleic acid-binding protein
MKTAKWLDSSAILTLLMAEPGFDTVRILLAAAAEEEETLFMAQISLAEIASALARAFGARTASDDMRLVREMPVRVCAPTDAQCVAAGLLRARFRLSTADALIATQAMDAQAELVHKDPEFEAVADLRQAALPYKRGKRA